MTSPMRHPEAGFPPEGFKSPLLQRSNSLPHSYQGAPPRLPMDPALSRSMSDVTPEAMQPFPPRMMPPQDVSSTVSVLCLVSCLLAPARLCAVGAPWLQCQCRSGLQATQSAGLRLVSSK